MEKVLIIGSPGAGKSMLAFELSVKTGLPLVHLDKLWWQAGWIESDREDFDARLAEELEKPRWIIDGNYSRTLPMRLSGCDTVIFLDFPRLTCLSVRCAACSATAEKRVPIWRRAAPRR